MWNEPLEALIPVFYFFHVRFYVVLQLQRLHEPSSHQQTTILRLFSLFMGIVNIKRMHKNTVILWNVEMTTGCSHNLKVQNGKNKWREMGGSLWSWGSHEVRGFISKTEERVLQTGMELMELQPLEGHFRFGAVHQRAVKGSSFSF